MGIALIAGRSSNSVTTHRGCLMPDNLTPCAICGIAVPLVMVCTCCGATVCLRDGEGGVCVACREARGEAVA
jgi:hypothetical protein